MPDPAPTPPTPAPAPAPTPPAPDPGPEKTFTQAELDRIIADRLSRSKVDPPADYEALKAKAAKFEEFEKSQLSDVEKLTKERDDALAKAAKADEVRNVALQRAAITTAAQRAGAVDPDAVFAMVDRSKVTIGDDGQVTGVDEAVKALLDTKQYLVGKPPTPTPGGADGGPRGKPSGTISREDLKNMTPEQISDAHDKGELAHLFTA